MATQINIGDAKTQLSRLVDAAVRGEDVVLAKAGKPQVRLVPVPEASDAARAALIAQRKSAIGMWSHLVKDGSIDVKTMKPTDADIEERYRRKFGDPA